MSIFPPRLFAVFLRGGCKKADSPPDAHKKFSYCQEFVAKLDDLHKGVNR